MVSVRGVYDLPAIIAVTVDVRDAVFKTRIGEVEATLFLPQSLVAASPLPAIYPAAMTDILARNDSFNHPFGWALPAPNESRSWMHLRRVGVELQHANPDEIATPTGSLGSNWDELSPGQRLNRAALSAIDDWFDLVRTWLEIQTKQDLDHKSHVSPVHLPGKTLRSHVDGEWISNDIYEVGDLSRPPATPQQLKIAFDRAGESAEPPIEHLLARDARATFARNDLRRAAVDAGTTVEVILNQVYIANMDSLHRETMSQDRRNLKSLRDALSEVNVHFDTRLETVIGARNGAAHQGEEPTMGEIEACLNFMEEMLSKHGRNEQLQA